MKFETYLKIYRASLVTVLLLHQSGAHSDENLDVALMNAVLEKSIIKFNALLENGANPNYVPAETKRNWVMCEVTRKGNEEFLVNALTNGANPNLRTKLSATASSAPILCAIGNHNLYAVKMLVDNGAEIDIDACSGCLDYKYSPLTVASIFNDYEIVDYLYNIKKPKDSDLIMLAHLITKKPMLINSIAAQWREKVTQKLRKNGIKVTPWTPKK